MPAIDANSNATALVTGANGFLAMWSIRVLLEQGFSVRGTVRAEDKGRKLKQIFSSHGDKFEWIVVKDITTQGAFDEAVKGVDAMAHTASPVVSNSEEPEAFIRPAVNGTLSILNSVLKYGTKVKRVVITSSVGVLLPIITAAWDFYAEHKAESGWELVVINPSIVIGPPLQEFETQAEVPHSVQLWFDHIFNEKEDEDLKGTFIYVDVREVAEAHLRSITTEAAGGERIVLSAGSSIYQQSRDIIFALKPEYYSSGVLPRGKPGILGIPVIETNTTKAQDILGIQYRSQEESIKSTLVAYEAKGLIVKI